MHNSRNNKKLAKGTKVLIPATVVGITPDNAAGGVGVHNIVVDTEHLEGEGTQMARKTTINLHASQVVTADGDEEEESGPNPEVQKLQEELDNTKTALDQKSNALEEATEKKENLESQVVGLKGKVESAEAERDAAKKELEEANKRADAAEEAATKSDEKPKA